MRLAVDCRMSGKSGIGAFIDGILPYLARSGNELVLVGSPAGFAGAPGVTVLSCTAEPFSVRELMGFPRALRDAVNACDAYFTPYCNVPGGIRVPVVTTIHDVVFLDMPGLAGRLGTFVRRCVYRRAVCRSAAVCTVSQFSKGRIEACLGCAKPVAVVHSSVPESLARPIVPAPAKTDTVLFIGNIKRHKGLQTLLPAFARFRERVAAETGRSPRLLIVGSQEHFRTKDSALSALQADAGQSGIVFTGAVPDARLRELLAEARVLVQPSLYEGFGLPPLQALCAGTAAVVSDIPVFREVYDGLPVTYFAAGDADDLAQKLHAVWTAGTCPPPGLQKYSFAATAQKVLAAIESVLYGA